MELQPRAPVSASQFPREGLPWTDKEVRYLLNGLQNGNIVEQLNVKMKRSIPSIVQHLAQLARNMYTFGISAEEIHERTTLDLEVVNELIAGKETPLFDSMYNEIMKNSDPAPAPVTPVPAPVTPASVANSHICEDAKPTSRHGVRWTPEEDQQVLDLANRRVSRDEIASVTGRTPTSIMCRLRDHAIKMIQEGQSLDEVALKLGLGKLYIQEGIKQKQVADAFKAERVAQKQAAQAAVLATAPAHIVTEVKLDQLIAICTEIRDLLRVATATRDVTAAPRGPHSRQ